MAKVDLDLVKMVLSRAKLDARTVAQILEDINFEAKAADDEPKEPLVKKQFVVVVSDPHGKFSQGTDYVGWVVQIPEEENPADAVERICKGAFDFNASPKGRRMPLKTIAEACEFGSAKLFKQHAVWIKTKEPVLIVPTNNIIPKG